MTIRAISLLVLIPLIAAPLSAWDALGHMAVANVAYQSLTPAARAEANRLIRLNSMYNQWVSSIPNDAAHQAERDLRAFMLAATWPDIIKSDGVHVSDGPDGGNRPPNDSTASQNVGFSDLKMHKYWHFKDVPFSRDGTHVDAPPTVNVQERIEVFRKVLSSPKPAGMTDAQFDLLKSYDLAWLLHLVGDVHQPLHCTSRFTATQTSGDAGGNKVKVKCTGCPGTLHSFWDDALGKSDDPDEAAAVAQDLDPADPAAGKILNSTTWVNESFALAKSKVYVSPVRNGAGPYTLTATYIDRADEVAAQQVALGGLRLANVLNAAFH